MGTSLPPSNGLLLTTEKLVKSYRGRRVVDDVSISVSAFHFASSNSAMPTAP